MLFDVAHPVRFAHMLDVALSSALPLDLYTDGAKVSDSVLSQRRH
jgi:hypothetical protein